MSVTVRRMNAEEKAFFAAIILRSTSVTKGAPYLASQIFALDPFVLDAPEDARGIPVFSVDEQARVYMHMSKIMKAGIDFASVGYIHEAQHVFRNHFSRFRNVAGRYDRDLVNIAEDLEINDDLAFVMKRGDGTVVDIPDTNGRMKAHYPEIQFSPVFPVVYDLDNHQSAEEYLYQLQNKRDEEEQEEDEQGQPGDSGQGSGEGGDQSDESGDGEGGEGEGDSTDGKHQSGACGGGSGTGEEPREWELGAKNSDPSSPAHSGKTPEELEIVRAKVASEINDYIKSNGIGSVPAGIARMAIEILGEPQVSWKQVVRGLILRTLRKHKAGHQEIDRSKRDRRYANVTQIIYPGKKDYVPTIGVGIDSSASMSKADMTTAITETDSILRSVGVRATGVEVFTVDAAVYETQKITRVEDISIKGGGGTDMMKCFDAFDKMEIDVGIIMTDGDCHWDVTRPKSRRYTAIVMVISTDASKANPALFPPGVIPIHVQPSAL